MYAVSKLKVSSVLSRVCYGQVPGSSRSSASSSSSSSQSTENSIPIPKHHRQKSICTLYTDSDDDEDDTDSRRADEDDRMSYEDQLHMLQHRSSMFGHRSTGDASTITSAEINLPQPSLPKVRVQLDLNQEHHYCKNKTPSKRKKKDKKIKPKSQDPPPSILRNSSRRKSFHDGMGPNNNNGSTADNRSVVSRSRSNSRDRRFSYDSDYGHSATNIGMPESPNHTYDDVRSVASSNTHLQRASSMQDFDTRSVMSSQTSSRRLLYGRRRRRRRNSCNDAGDVSIEESMQRRRRQRRASSAGDDHRNDTACINEVLQFLERVDHHVPKYERRRRDIQLRQ